MKISSIIIPALITVLFIMAEFTMTTAAAQDRSTKATEKRAGELFEKGRYSEAKKLYSNLVSLYPKQPDYNYRYGACLLFSEPDKTKSLKYFDYAVSRSDVNIEAYYYAGRGYHYNYRFDRALEFYDKFKQKAGSKDLKKHPVEMQIRMCQNGKQLLKNISEPDVLDVKPASLSEFQLSYELSGRGIKLLKTLNELQTKEDEDRMYKGLMFKHDQHDEVWFSSYGESDETGIDIYRARVDGSGKFAKPEKLPAFVNTDYDDAYPFFDYENDVLYFSSKGHNSMGGYDIFKIEYDRENDMWGTPENLDYAVNTPDDDMMYVVLPGGDEAYFSSSRNNDEGRVNVYRVKHEKQPLKSALLVGTFQSDKYDIAEITVEKLPEKTSIGTYKSRAKDGRYIMKLETGTRYNFIVKPGFSDVLHAGEVRLPEIEELKPLAQEMYIEEIGGREQLVIKNKFEENTDVDEEIMSDYLADVAKLKKSKVEKNIAKTNEEILNDLNAFEKNYDERISEFEELAAASYFTAENKMEKADEKKKVLDRLRGKSESAAHGVEAEAVSEEMREVKADYEKLIYEANTAAALGDQFKKEADEERKIKAEAASSSRKAGNYAQADDRGQVVKTYLDFTEKHKPGRKKEPREKAYRNFRDDAEAEQRKASEYRKRYDELSVEERELNERISFLKGQKEQVRKRSEKESIEYQIEAVREDLRSVEDEKKKIGDESARLKESAELKKTRLEHVDDLLASLTSAKGKSPKTADPATLTAQTDNEAAALLSEEKEIDISRKPQKEKTELAREQREPGESPEPREEQPQKVESRSEPEYEAHYRKKREEVKAVPEPETRALALTKLLTYEKRDMERELDELKERRKAAGSDREKQRVEERIEELENRIEESEKEHRNAAEEYARQRKSPEQFRPDEELSESFAVQDIEDKYFFDYETVASEDPVEEVEKTADITERYLADVREMRDKLNDRKKETDQGSKIYSQLEAEISSLDKLIALKEEQLSYNKEILEGAQIDAYDGKIESGVRDESAALAETRRDSEPERETATDVSTADSRQTESAGGDDRYFGYSEAELRDESFNLGESPYNAEFKEQYKNIEGESRVERTRKSKEIDRQWLEEIKRDIAVLKYHRDQTRGEEEKAAFDGKIEDLEAQKRQKESRIKLNDMILARIENDDTDTSTESRLAEDTSQETDESEIVETETGERRIHDWGETERRTEEIPDDYERKRLDEAGREEQPYEPSSEAEELIGSLKEAEKEAEKQLENIEKELRQARVEAENAKRRDRDRSERRVSNLEAEAESAERRLEIRKAVVRESERLAAGAADSPSKKYADSAAAARARAKEVYETATVLRRDKHEEAAAEKIKESSKLERKADDLQKIADELAGIEGRIGSGQVVAERDHPADKSVEDQELRPVPAPERSYTEGELADARNSEKYIEFENAKESYDREIRQASVLYEEAREARDNARDREERIKELEAEGGNIDQINRLREESEFLKRRADQQENQARRKENRGKRDFNSALEAIENDPDPEMRDKLLALAAAETGVELPAESAGQPDRDPEETADREMRTREPAERETRESTPPRETVGSSAEKEFTLLGNRSAYNESNPIPSGIPEESGVRYRVQIGAFSRPVPHNAFSGFSPIVREPLPGGITRYLAGNFTDLSSADRAKEQIRSLGYTDAFVTAYRDGKRVSMSDVRSAQPVAAPVPTEPAPEVKRNLERDVKLNVSEIAYTDSPVRNNSEIVPAADRGELYFTVQIGAYRTSTPVDELPALSPLNRDELSTGITRYSAGIYSTLKSAVEAKRRIQQSAVPDAFVTAYYRGERISINRALELGSDREQTPLDTDSREEETRESRSEPEPELEVPEKVEKVAQAPEGIAPGQFTVLVGPYEGRVPVREASEILKHTGKGINIQREGETTWYQIGIFDTVRDAERFALQLRQSGIGMAKSVTFAGEDN